MKRSSWLDRVGATLRTARHLRPRQLLDQLVHRARGPARDPASPRASGCDDFAAAHAFEAPSSEGHPVSNGAIELLGAAAYDPLRQGWSAGDDPLWSYTLHYHGWLNHPDLEPAQGLKTILDWIEHHPRGVGWEPYPVSMRLLHWLGWLAHHAQRLSPGERRAVLASLAGQLRHLATHVETHLDGNHLWTNLSALVTAGLALRGPLPGNLLDRFGPRLLATTRAQLNADGMHAERTPTYHCLLAEQLALVSALASERPELGPAAHKALAAMIGVLPAFTHPDGDVALWGDSQLGAPASPASLRHRTGLESSPGSADAPASGFFRRCWGPWTLLHNVGFVGMAHQCGHIHADALSVELSLGTERVLVDAGTGTYAVGADRAYARSTRAHNTATVGDGDPDQHEMWKSHRIGARAEPWELRCEANALESRVHGHASPAAHERRIEWDGTAIQITDRAGGARAVARLHLPATIRIEGDASHLQATTPRGQTFVIEARGAPLQTAAARGWTAIGVAAPRTCVSAPIGDDGLVVTLHAE